MFDEDLLTFKSDGIVNFIALLHSFSISTIIYEDYCVFCNKLHFK